MKILYNNNIYDYNTQGSESDTIKFTVDMGQTDVGIPIASRLWITDTINDKNTAIAAWVSDGSENIVLADLVDDCWHDHAKENIHGAKVVEVMCEDSDRLPIDSTLALNDTDEEASSFQAINALLTSSLEDTGTSHQRTLMIYGSNTNKVYFKITFIGETISEDTDIEAMANLQGYHIAPEDSYVFYEADPYEPVYSSSLLNRKRKEYLLCIDRLKDKIGSQQGILDVIKFFGYNDLYVGSLWKVTNTDSPYYKGYSIRYKNSQGNSNTLDEYDVHYKQVNRAVLVYKIVKTLDQPFDKLPNTAVVNSYGIDGNSIKLARLREVMNEQFMPAAIPIREILGECDVYYAAKCYTSTADNLTEYNYTEHNIRLSIAKQDIYEFRLSRYYALALKIFDEDYIAKIAKAEQDCLPDTFSGCILYRLKRIQTIYEYLKDKKELQHDPITVWYGANEEDNINIPYFVYLLTTPKTEDTSNFLADTYSSIHSEAITIMMYLFEACEYLTDKLHQDALEMPDALWTIWQETAYASSQPVTRTDDYVYSSAKEILEPFTNRYCGCVSLSLSSQDAFHYKWNDIHSWWNHTVHYNDDKSIKSGMTWANFASITKIEWTLTLHDNTNIKYTYTCEKSDPTKSIPHMKDGIADYDIYGVPVVASLFVYHIGVYDVEAIIYDNFGHVDRLYRENALEVHPSDCYLTGIAQNAVIPIDRAVEESIEESKSQSFIDEFCNSYLYGPMKYNRTLDNANGILFKMPYFPKVVTTDSDYYLYPFTINNAIDAAERYDHTNDADPENTSPFVLPNIIPSQPTALILPLKNANLTQAPSEDMTEDELREYVISEESDYKVFETNTVKLANTGTVLPANCIVAIKGTQLYKYNMSPYGSQNTFKINNVISDLESLEFFKNYKWQITYMPDAKTPILLGIAKSITEDTDIDDIYFANTDYTEYIDTVKDSSPINYDISFVSHRYDVVLKCQDETDLAYENITYARAIEIIKNLYQTKAKAYYIHSIKKTSITQEITDVPKIQGIIYDAFIGMPHYGTWSWIAGGYIKLKKYSWLVASIDNNNIPAKNNIIWDIERRSIWTDKDNPKPNGTVNVEWDSTLNDDAFEVINCITRENANKGGMIETGFPRAYLPYMFTKIGQYRISCKFRDINGDDYTTPYIIIDVE